MKAKAKALNWTKWRGYRSFQICKPSNIVEMTVNGTSYLIELIIGGQKITAVEGSSPSMEDAKNRCQTWWNRHVRSMSESVEFEDANSN